uniref:Hexamerin receptor n=1 Tax=Corcyra cephalonica TaxID=139036 RepID=D2XTA5_CORCP|nr:hexamerin receptor [Corcyra cephalonica]
MGLRSRKVLWMVKMVILVMLLVTVATASVVPDDSKVLITKEPMVNLDVKTKELFILKLLNHILQPSLYEDIRSIAREYTIEDNMDKYVKVEVVKAFIATYKLGMLPRGEVFVDMDVKQAEEAIKVFQLLYFAKDFDIFVRTACWLRERINGGMFVYALTAAVFHRPDCNGISLPAPYEIYPHHFVDSHILHKAFMMKMTKASVDAGIKDYYGINVKDNNVVVIDWRKSLRHTMSEFDRTSYFTEDIDLNTYFYYLHMSYPYWMSEDIYSVNKERRGETMWYSFHVSTVARRLGYKGYRLPCTTLHPQCEMYHSQKATGRQILLRTGDEMPVRCYNVQLITEDDIRFKDLIDDDDRRYRDAIRKGYIETHDGTTLSLRKPDDIEYLSRMLLGGYVSQENFRWQKGAVPLTLLSYSNYNTNKNTYIPHAVDTFATALRDPGAWKLMKKLSEIFILFKNMLPSYTRDEFDFPGVKIEQVSTDKLVTFMDEYNVDITNAMYLDKTEMQNQRSDMMYVARMHRLNHHPFKVTIEVVSDKAVDSVVRVFLGPKIDCMGRFISINDKRNDMVEIDSFLYKLDTGKNTIIRNSLEMHNVIQERPLVRGIWERSVDANAGMKRLDNWWYKSRIGFPHRLLLPIGSIGGTVYEIFRDRNTRTHRFGPAIFRPEYYSTATPLVDGACAWTRCRLVFPTNRPLDEGYLSTHQYEVPPMYHYYMKKFVPVSHPG